MNAELIDEKAVFNTARHIDDPAAREAFLSASCRGEADTLQRIRELLRVHSEAQSFLESPAAALAATGTEQAPAEGPGTLIGPYKLIEQIGEGGFGVVYMAEQTQPVRRKVALKILKPGMDTRQVVARFEAERQALALMDHPHIAKVLDAGATSTGRPYFVMELVKGVPITEFCDQSHLNLRERLELFVSACSAVQHAHQKGIIHRDLKPSNVLVALYDERPVPKVIDFGVAKAIGEPLTEQTLHTGFWAVLGTLEYMSPEQASLNQLDVDTRSDIYSLGILLYELLTGSTPLDQKRAKEAGLLESLRIIREEEVPTLSNRLSTTAELASIAARRGLEPAKLTRQVRGELNWILMKALEKDRDRRYATATAFAADVERYLSDEPVLACPPSAGYRFRKFTRRNKGAVLAVAAIFLLLVAGITGTTLGLVRAEHARQAETQQRMRAEAAVVAERAATEAEAEQRRLAEAAVASERAAKEAEAEQRARAEDAHKKAAREAAMAAAINDFFNKDILQLSSAIGQAIHGVSPDGNLKLSTVVQRAARRIDGKFPNEPEVEMRLRYTIGYALLNAGDADGALPQFEKVVSFSTQLLGRDDPDTLKAEYRLGMTHRQLRHFDVAVSLLEDNVERHKSVLGEAHPQTLLAMNGLSIAFQSAGQSEKALQLAQHNLEARKRRLGPTHADTLVSMNNVAWMYQQRNQPEKAMPVFEETLAAMQANLAPLHPERINTTANLARTYHAAEQIDKAVPMQESVVQPYKTVHGIDDARTQQVIDNLITWYVDIGWWDKAEALLKSIQSGGANRPTSTGPTQSQRETRFRELIQRVGPAADNYQRALAARGAADPETLAARQALALVLRDQKRTGAAAWHLQAVLDARQRLLGADHPDLPANRLELGSTRLQQKKYASAEPLLLEAYAGLKQQETNVPESTSRTTEALERLVQLYDGWDKNDQATEWRQRLDERKKK